MSKIDEATEILTSLGLPRRQQNERSALTLIALANIGPDDSWPDTERPLLRIWDIMGFMRARYGKDYAANSRETIRRQTIHQFEQARLVDRNPDDPDRPTNSGKTVYALTQRAAEIFEAYRTADFDSVVAQFITDSAHSKTPTVGFENATQSRSSSRTAQRFTYPPELTTSSKWP